MGRKKTDFNQIKYNNDYTRDNYARLSVLVPKGAKGAILAHIESKGYKSTSDYFKSLLARDMDVTDLSELVGGGRKMIKKIWRWSYMHPRTSLLTLMLIVVLITLILDGNMLISLFCLLIFTGIMRPILFSRRNAELRKQELDYLARRTAEENAKLKDPQ